MSARSSVIEIIELLAQPSKQLQYERDVPIANVPAELICMFCDDLYHPKSEQFISSFSSDELKDLAHLYGVLCEAANLEVKGVLDLQRQPKWRTVVAVAKNLSAHYANNA